MIGDKGFTDDSVRSLIYLLCNQKAFKKITDFENDEIFEDGPLIGFSSQMNNDITEDLEKDTYYVYLNTNAIYEVAKLSVKAFEIYSFEDIFKKIRSYFTQHYSTYRFNNIAVFYKLDIGMGLYKIMEGFYNG